MKNQKGHKQEEARQRKLDQAMKDVINILEHHCTQGDMDDILLEKLKGELEDIAGRYRIES